MPTPTQCRHIFPDGHRCGSPSLRHEHFCYYHHTTRAQFKRPEDPGAPRYREPFTLPIIEDRTSLQTALNQILQGIVTSELDCKRAGLLLYGLQIAVQLLPKPKPTAQTPASPEADPITDPILDSEHRLLAPIATLQAATESTQAPTPKSTHNPSPHRILHKSPVHPPVPNPSLSVHPCSSMFCLSPIPATSLKKKNPPFRVGSSILCRRSPNLPHTYACSTIGPTRLNFRVRDGNGCDPRGKLTGKL